MSTALAQRVLDEYAAVRESLPADVVSAARRQEALAALAESGLPTPREENWRYTNLRPLERARFAPVTALDTPSRANGSRTSSPDGLELPAQLADFARYTFVDGHFAPGLSSPLEQNGAAMRTLRLGRAPSPASAAPRATRTPPEARLALLNQAFATDGVAIHVDGCNADVEPARIELVFLATAGAEVGTSYPRVEVALAPGARLTLLERHVSAGTSASFINCSVNVDLGTGAQLTHYRLQQVGIRSTWLDTLTAVLAADARYGLITVSAGALSARSTTYVRMAGAGAALTQSAAALGDHQQVEDNFTLVEHAAPRARTEQTFRGIAAGRARVAFNGRITVREGAAGTDTRQSLRGLLAGPEAEIDVRPQLEIYTDDVRCNHGATAGKLDDRMLFYLLSRGLSPEVAQRLLKWAFLEDVISQISVPQLRRQIEQALASQMVDAASLQEVI